MFDELLKVYELLRAEEKTVNCRVCNKSPRLDLQEAIALIEKLIGLK